MVLSPPSSAAQPPAGAEPAAELLAGQAPRRRLTRWLAAGVLAQVLGLAGCDQLGIESTAATAARKEAEGKAIGAGCRHAARSVEQCYVQNKRADKAAVFAGWKEMNDYMRENKIEAVPPPPPEPAEGEGGHGDEAAADKTGAKPAAKAAAGKH